MTEPDFESMSVEDLDKLMEHPELIGQAPETPAPEPVAEVKPTPEAAPEPVKAEEPAPVEEDLDAKIRDTRIEEYEAKAKHWESVAGKHAGELGFLRGEIKQLRDAQLRAPEADSHAYDERPAPAPPARVDSVTQWAVQKSVEEATGKFLSGHPDYDTEMHKEMAEYLQKSGYDPKAVMESADPVWAAREAERALEEAYWHSKARRTAAVRADLETRRATQTAKAKDAKVQAAVSGSGGSAPPATPEKPVAEMSVAELEKRLVHLTR